MGVFGGPEIPNDGLVLALDAGNPRNFNLTAVEVLVVGGGGGGGGYHGGGGGAGGLIYNSNFAVTPGTQLAATVGAGGDAPTSSSNTGNPGGNSVFGALTAIGGGAGISQGNEAQARNNGGSGGGGCDGTGSVLHSGGSGTSGQGFKGGDVFGDGPSLAVYYGTAGGGGAGGAGGTGGILNGGFGGPGLGFNISGTSTYYAGGGGGTHLGSSSITNYGIGGIGGGGTGGISPSPYNSAFRSSTSGSPNTGGGGGGHLYSGLGGGAGGSGIIIVRYPGPQKAIGGTVTSVGGDTIHTFTTSGNFTPLVNTNGSAVLGLSDLSGNRNFGTSVNGVTYSSANGGSLSFDGVDDYVNCGSPSTLNFGTGNFNLSCWVNIPSTSGADWIGIISRYVSGAGFWILLNPGNRYVGFGWDASNYITSSSSAGGGQWKFISCQRTGSTSAEVYVNGILVASSSSMLSGTSNGQQIDIGRMDIAGRYSAGNIAQTQIYNRALTAAEVSQNFIATRSRYGI